MGSIPIKHHYVPQVYLKNFSYDNKRVFVLRKNSRYPVSASISDICAERDFYSRFSNHNYRDTKVENTYSKIEGGPLKDIMELFPKDLIYPYRSGGIVLDPLQKIKLSEVVMLQITRGKSARNYGRSIAESLYHELISETREKHENVKNAEDQYRFLEENKDAILNNALVEGPILPFVNNREHSELRRNLQNRNCVIFINHTSLNFVTSDDPVLVGNNLGNVDKIFNYPLGNSDSQVYYPLSPKHLAVLFTQESCGNICCDKGLSAILSEEDIAFVKNFNIAQYKQRINCVISGDTETLNDINNFMQKD